MKPSQACKVVGWKDLPHAGGEVLQVESEKRAHQVLHWRKEQEVKARQAEELRLIEQKREVDRKKYEELRMKRLEVGMMHLNYGRYDFHVRGKESQLEERPPKVSFVVKADVDGSLEAIVGCLNTYKSSEVEMVTSISWTHAFASMLVSAAERWKIFTTPSCCLSLVIHFKEN